MISTQAPIVRAATLPPQVHIGGRPVRCQFRSFEKAKRRRADDSKPRGWGFWTSSLHDVDIETGWSAWCSDNRFGDNTESWWLLIPRADAVVLNLSTPEDGLVFIRHYNATPDRTYIFFDWRRIRDDGVDAVRVEDSVLHAMWDCKPLLAFYGWDCESTVWLRWVFDGAERLPTPPASDA